ncbi:MAG: hypothetical protein K0Q87_3957, partial [Neobacillus sp.]|nr:hypothetical protein [Neobacillus sp.]
MSECFVVYGQMGERHLPERVGAWDLRSNGRAPFARPSGCLGFTVKWESAICPTDRVVGVYGQM